MSVNISTGSLEIQSTIQLTYLDATPFVKEVAEMVECVLDIISASAVLATEEQPVSMVMRAVIQLS